MTYDQVVLPVVPVAVTVGAAGGCKTCRVSPAIVPVPKLPGADEPTSATPAALRATTVSDEDPRFNCVWAVTFVPVIAAGVVEPIGEGAAKFTKEFGKTVGSPIVKVLPAPLSVPTKGVRMLRLREFGSAGLVPIVTNGSIIFEEAIAGWVNNPQSKSKS
jgi:hypothetical protein